MKSINALGLSLLLAGTLSLAACSGEADVDTGADTTDMSGDTAGMSTPGTTTGTGMGDTAGMGTTGTGMGDTTGMGTTGTGMGDTTMGDTGTASGM
jgi:penicillin-binding protein 1A